VGKKRGLGEGGCPAHLGKNAENAMAGNSQAPITNEGTVLRLRSPWGGKTQKRVISNPPFKKGGKI